MTYTSTYYDILGLPKSLHDEPSIPAQILRLAYRRALLQNHPDKSQLASKPPLTSAHATYSIDQISEAFSTLSNPTARAKYDKELRLQNVNVNVSEQIATQGFRTGVEVVDLDDLSVDEVDGTWYRSCRCGDDRGFLIREADLEDAADDGELSVGCKGCSLWLKVLFGVMEDEVHGEAADIGGARDDNA